MNFSPILVALVTFFPAFFPIFQHFPLQNPAKMAQFYPALEATIRQLEAEEANISAERRKKVIVLANFVHDKLQAKQKTELTFICTHNSRRSQIAQCWAKVAAERYGVANVRTYSGGTEVTAFNPRAVAALERVGFTVQRKTELPNPHYAVAYSPEAAPILAFSKKFGDEANPAQGFAAVMTCSQAEAQCPFVAGTEKRISIPYDDPKEFDDTPQEQAKYDERVREIGREMLWAFRQAMRSGK